MSTVRSLFARPETKGALAAWALIPTLFLFFALTLAVDPSVHIDRLRLGTAVLDRRIETPQGVVSIGPKLLEGLRQKIGFELVSYPTEADLRAAILDHDVAAGIVVPAGMTAAVTAGTPVELAVIRSDANDPFTNAFTNTLTTQLTANVNTALAELVSGGGAAASPATPLVAVVPVNVAATTDFRFVTLPAALVLPLWAGTLAFAVLFTRAAGPLRKTTGAVQMALVELGVGALGAAITATVVTADIAFFVWRADLDLLGLFAILWVGFTAMALLLQGAMRLLGIGLGAALGVVALFIQQPVSGALFPPAFAPDVVRWVEPIAPLRFLLEGFRNTLIGGTSTPEMAASLAALGVVGVALFAAGVGLSALGARRRTAVVPAASA